MAHVSTSATSEKQRTVLLVEAQEGRNAPTVQLLLESLVPVPMLEKMRRKQHSVDPEWLMYDDLAETKDDAEEERMRESRLAAIDAARVPADDGGFLDISRGIPSRYEIVLVVSCLPY